MGRFAEQFAEQRCRLEKFNRRYSTYVRYKQQIAVDPEAPKGALDLLARGLSKAAVVTGRRAPIAGILLDYVDEDAASEKASAFVSYLARKISNKEDLVLMREPTSVLSPLFLKDLNQLADKQRVILMFDTFEHTRVGLETWLHDLLKGEYGEISLGITFVISGRDILSQLWSDLSQWTCRILLEPFSDQEALSYLNRRGITDTELVTTIINTSNGVPVLLELLASSAPQVGQPLSDVSGEAVARFLQWVDEPVLRHTALIGCVPRRLNRDVLTAVLGRDEKKDVALTFDWLVAQPFVVKRGDGFWHYHGWVRELMLKHLRHVSPAEFADAHQGLAAFYSAQRDAVGLSGKAPYANERWFNAELERFYHQISQDLDAALPDALNGYLATFHMNFAFAQRWAVVLQQVAHESNSTVLKEWGELQAQGYEAWDNGRWTEVVHILTRLLEVPQLTRENRSFTYASRGFAFQRAGHLDQALADYD